MVSWYVFIGKERKERKEERKEIRRHDSTRDYVMIQFFPKDTIREGSVCMDTQYNTILGTNHTIDGIGYNQIIKTILPGKKIRSAQEQYTIQMLAYEFTSRTIFIPKPLNVIDNRSYTMDEFRQGEYVNPDKYFHSEELFEELLRFYDYMKDVGYWPFRYTIYKYPNEQYVLCGFSQFGTIQGNRVKFPKNPHIFSLEEVEKKFSPRFYYFSIRAFA